LHVPWGALLLFASSLIALCQPGGGAGRTSGHAPGRSARRARGLVNATPPFPHCAGRLARPSCPAPLRRSTLPRYCPDASLVFPDDFGAHPDFRTEWWYATGWLKRQDGRRWAFRSPSSASVPASAKPAPAALPRANCCSPTPPSPTRNWPLASQRTRGPRRLRPCRLYAGPQRGLDWRLATRPAGKRRSLPGQRTQASDFAYDLALVASAPPLLNGRGGFSSKAADPRHASYYYSRPQLAVSGSVSLNGRPK
jgi:hypothetical protein